MKTLNRHALMKKKFVRANEIPFMIKVLRKAVMKRSELESKYQIATIATILSNISVFLLSPCLDVP